MDVILILEENTESKRKMEGLKMFQDEFQAVCNAGRTKIMLLQKNPLGYFVSSMLAGAFVAFGAFVCFVIGTPLKAVDSPMTKALMAFAFASALSLVILAGAELFTGNTFVLPAAALSKTITWQKAIKNMVVSYIGNLAGALLAVFLFQLTGVANGAVGEHFAAASEAKMALEPLQLLTKGILCNMLVCLAVWCGIKLKSESGKLIMIFWCIFIFMACGFEHSVANMTTMAVGLLNATTQTVSIGGYCYNLILATIGNIIGGALFVAVPYYLISRKTTT